MRAKTPPRELKRSSEVKTCGAANVSANIKSDISAMTQQPEKSRLDDVRFEVDPWFVGADPWDVEKVVSEGKAEPYASQGASTDKKEDPWFAEQGADPWGAAKNKSTCGAKAEGARKLKDHTSSKHTDMEEDPWFGAGIDPWNASKQRNDKKEDHWFVSPAADPWKQAPRRNPKIGKSFQMTSEGDAGEAGQSSARGSSRAERPLEVLRLAAIEQCSPPHGLSEPANIKLPDVAPIGLRNLALEPASIGIRDPPPGLPVPTFPSDGFSWKVTAPPGLSLVDAPPGLDAPLPLGIPQLDVPVGLSAPPGLLEPGAHCSIQSDASAQGIEHNETNQAFIEDAGRANKTNRWNKNKHGASD
jgi:hypothetical protein